MVRTHPRKKNTCRAHGRGNHLRLWEGVDATGAAMRGRFSFPAPPGAVLLLLPPRDSHYPNVSYELIGDVGVRYKPAALASRQGGVAMLYIVPAAVSSSTESMSLRGFRSAGLFDDYFYRRGFYRRALHFCPDPVCFR